MSVIYSVINCIICFKFKKYVLLFLILLRFYLLTFFIKEMCQWNSGANIYIKKRESTFFRRKNVFFVEKTEPYIVNNHRIFIHT